MKHLPTDLDQLRLSADALGTPLSTEQAALLGRLERLIVERAVPIGAVAGSDAPRIRERHILDCLRGAAEVGTASTAYDLGSGAGLPGLVIAIAAPDLQVGLVETRRHRAAFLELAIQELGLVNAQVHATRTQDLSQPADLCFARAFAPVEGAWAAAEPLLSPGGRLVYFAGAGRTALQAPPGARIVALRTNAVLESAGPLVIMTRQ